ncbi:uncharacterized protein LOC131853013 [Achroia grisella]|uniref:uncharacterized protein LOC131853013 n=1 Tax=Achroia grisella TaxID=688607 RepID=UPI0027D1F723|nr:uncharacterized protein LOC131853013 [Achroia grisella]
MRALLILAVLVCLHWNAKACDPDQTHYGCKFYGSSCYCSYGCKNEYIYITRKDCLSALRERNPNICFRMPCLRGICIQTTQDPGFTCKCEGTGFYGQRCEKACPSSVTLHGLIFPHECIVI